MFKLNTSLKGSLLLAFAIIVLILVMGYSSLSARYFIKGMDTIIVDSMIRAATAVANSRGGVENNALDGYAVTRQWSDQPAWVTSAAPAPPTSENQLQRVLLERPGRLIFYMITNTSQGPFYVSFQTVPDRVSDLVSRNAIGSLVTLLVIGLGSAVVLTIVVWWLMRRVTQPVSRLGVWARGLNEQTLDEKVPDFGFRDLNDFADVVRTSLISVKEGLDREQVFLQQVSHELRTPISVIRSNVQLLNRLKNLQADLQRDTREGAAVDRIERASLTMKHMTETLLWLGREDGAELPRSKLRLDHLLESTINDLKYLLDGKSVQLSVHTDPCTVDLSDTAARIVLGNLVRNAFQHTWEGRVDIVQVNGKIEISNFQETETDANEDLGFGLGLQLTEKLTQRLDWRFENTVRRNGRSVRLCFEAGVESPEADLKS